MGGEHLTCHTNGYTGALFDTIRPLKTCLSRNLVNLRLKSQTHASCATTMETTTKLSMRLLIDGKAHKVLFAEARKDIVDFLFNLLAFPLGTVVRLLTKESMMGCLGNLYESVKNLDDTYIEPDQSKESLLEPTVATCVAQVPLLMPKQNTASAKAPVYYMCNYSHQYITDTCGIGCPSCGRQMSDQASYVESQTKKVESTGDGGYVKGVVTYMVMDDLVVTPMSTISCITLINTFNVKDLGSLEDRVVQLGMEEGLELLKYSLQSKSVLTDVFLGKKIE